MSINRVIISGNLTRDPEMRQTAGGMAVMGFGVAVNDRRKNQQTGEWEDYPNFIDCTMFGARAEAVSRFLRKGSKVAIEGKLRYSSWERDGQKRSKIEVIVDEIEFMSPRDGNGGYGNGGYGNASYGNNSGYNNSGYNNNAGYNPAPQQQPQPAVPVVNASVYDEDIPF
ncbi:MAG: single-stranded DNA-binding protein [Eggerthellaceae bacterium]|nr:single-stranded DNA-binding protein [Eggerthellaceae bacterium]